MRQSLLVSLFTLASLPHFVAGASTPISQPVSLRITEFFIDSRQPNGADEYIEISGPVNTYFTNAQAPGEFSYYLLMLQNVGGDAGSVDKVIALCNTDTGPSGFAWYFGSGGEGYPANGGFAFDGEFEKSGCTLMLIAVPFGTKPPAPSDTYHDKDFSSARLGGDWDPNWIVLDSVGVFCRASDVDHGGALYAPVNFIAGDPHKIATYDGAENVTTRVEGGQQHSEFDINYVGRKIDGQWFAAYLSDQGLGWSNRRRDYRIAGDKAHGDKPLCVDETGHTPYRTNQQITITLGFLAPMAPCNCGSLDRATAAVEVARNSTSPSGPEPTLALPEANTAPSSTSQR